VPSPADARQSLLKLTQPGHQAFAPLQQRSRDEAAALLASLPASARERLIGAMATVQHLLDPARRPEPTRTVVLRDPRPGDMGWVVQQHGEIYWREYRFDSEFEALVADVAAKYMKNFNPAWEKGWIAEIDGERVGSGCRAAATVAQLRLLILTRTRLRLRRTPHGRMRRLRAQQGLPQADALDAEPPPGGSRHLPVARLPPREERALRGFRAADGQRSLGDEALMAHGAPFVQDKRT
jgi:hypothetical protein